MDSSNDKTKRRTSWRRAVGFRLAAIGLALGFFAGIELLLMALGMGEPTQLDDPFVGFSDIHPLFVRSPDAASFEIAPSRFRTFRPQSFPAVKDPNEFRIFCLGGSTVQGRPYAVETSFTTWLEIYLQLADPSRKWRAINCGGISYASYRLTPILQEALTHQPDLIVLYTGNNEFLEDREYAHIRDRSRWIAAPWELVARTRMFNLLHEGYLRMKGTSVHQDRPRTILQADVEAILDYEGGLDKYHRDEAWRAGVIAHFDHNVRRMVRLAGEAGVPMLLINPVCNLRDCPPFKSQHRDGLTDEQLRQWTALYREADVLAEEDTGCAVLLRRQALAIDDQHAGLHYRLAKDLDAMRDVRRAREEYVRAKELDICPLRILDAMNEAILRIAQETGAPLVDARKLIELRSDEGIPGDSLLADHVHPRISAHRLIANALVDELARMDVAHPRPHWRQEQEARSQEHIASLGLDYFTEGIERLEALRNWAAGRATLPLPEPPPKKP